MRNQEMSASSDQKAAFVKKVISSPLAFEAFKDLDIITRAEASYYFPKDPQDKKTRAQNKSWLESLRGASSVNGMRRTTDPEFRAAWDEVSGTFYTLIDRAGSDKAVLVLDELRKNWTLRAMYFASEIKSDERMREAFPLYATYRKKQLDQEYKTANNQTKESDWDGYISDKMAKEKFSSEFSAIGEEIKAMTVTSGAIGPFAEQLVIETVERNLDQDVHKPKVEKVGKGLSGKKAA